MKLKELGALKTAGIIWIVIYIIGTLLSYNTSSYVNEQLGASGQVNYYFVFTSSLHFLIGGVICFIFAELKIKNKIAQGFIILSPFYVSLILILIGL
jgi:hypothetical protein